MSRPFYPLTITPHESWRVVRRRLPVLRSDPNEHIARYGKMNPFRDSDIVGPFASRYTPAQLIASRKISVPKDRICSWWCERYDDSALSTELALVAGSTA